MALAQPRNPNSPQNQRSFQIPAHSPQIRCSDRPLDAVHNARSWKTMPSVLDSGPTWTSPSLATICTCSSNMIPHCTWLSSAPLYLCRQGYNSGNRRLKVRAFAIHHVALECRIAGGKARICHKTGNGLQGFSHRVCAVSGELMAISRGIREHDLSCQEPGLGEIVMPPDHVQIIHMAHDRR